MAKDLKITVKAVSAKGSANTKGVVGSARQANVTAGTRQASVTGKFVETPVVGEVSEVRVVAKPSDPTIAAAVSDLRVSISVDTNLLAGRPSVSPFLFQYIEDSIGHSDLIHLSKQRVASNIARTMDDTVFKIGKRFLETGVRHDDFRVKFTKPRSNLLTTSDSQSIFLSKPRFDAAVVRDLRRKSVGKRKTDKFCFEHIVKKLLTKGFSERLGHSDDILGASVADDDVHLQVRKNKTDTHTARDVFSRLVRSKRTVPEPRKFVEEIRADVSKKLTNIHAIVDYVKLSKIFNRYLTDQAKRTDHAYKRSGKVREDFQVSHDTVKIVVTWKRKFSNQARLQTKIKFGTGKPRKDLTGLFDNPAFLTNKKKVDTHGARDVLTRTVSYHRIKVDFAYRSDDVKFSASKSLIEHSSSLCKLKFITYKLLKTQARFVTWVSKGITKKTISVTGLQDSVILLKTQVRRFNEQTRLLDTVTAFRQNYANSSYFAGDYVGQNYTLE